MNWLPAVKLYKSLLISPAEILINEFLQVLSIKPDQIHLSDQNLGTGSYADVCIGSWHGVPVAVKKFDQLITSPRN
eukprot:m.292873 g.292873  ORF g.292873 m.292873 type:complete len:76 (+) comp40732_c1_seq18:1063-1290(+)